MRITILAITPATVNIDEELEKYTPHYNHSLGHKREVKEVKEYKCIKCNSNRSRESKSGLCIKCMSKSKRKVERPSLEELEEIIKEKGYVGTGKHFGVF